MPKGLRCPQGLKPWQKNRLYRSAGSAAPPKIEFVTLASLNLLTPTAGISSYIIVRILKYEQMFRKEHFPCSSLPSKDSPSDGPAHLIPLCFFSHGTTITEDQERPSGG